MVSRPALLSSRMPFTNKNIQMFPEEFDPSVVSGSHECKSSEARLLCIYDFAKKIPLQDKFDIGGTYSENDTPDLAFYFTTTTCPSSSYILNLFVCHRNIGSFKISISNLNHLDLKKEDNIKDLKRYIATLPKTSKVFTSSKLDEHHFIRSFCFSHLDISSLEESNVTTFYIHIAIEINPKKIISEDALNIIQKTHVTSMNVLKRNENTDLNLVSESGTSFATHKLLLCECSPVLREIIKNTESNVVTVDINDEAMNIFLGFLYSGTIQVEENKDWPYMLELAGKFEIDKLGKMTQNLMEMVIDKDNALTIALLSEKYKLDKIQKKVFDFIKVNPDIMETEAWNNITDVELTKKFLKEIITSAPYNN